MFFIIVNTITLLAGLALIAWQIIQIFRFGLAENIKAYLMGKELLFISFLSILFSVISAWELDMTGGDGILLIGALSAGIMYGALLFCWFILKRKLLKAPDLQEVAKHYPHIAVRLRKHYFNLTIYGLVYCFALLYFIIVLINFLGGKK